MIKNDRVSIPLKIVIKVASVMVFVKVMSILTKYPPFALFWTDRPFHYRNRFIKKGLDVIRQEAAKAKVYLDLRSTKVNMPFFIYNLYLPNLSAKKTLFKIKKPLSEVFNTTPDFIYLRSTQNRNTWQFLIPLEEVYPDEDLSLFSDTEETLFQNEAN